MLVRGSIPVVSDPKAPRRRGAPPEQKPDPLFNFVDPHLEQARCSHVAILFAQFVYLPHPCSELDVVFPQLREHAVRRHVLAVVVGHALQARNLADGTKRGAANLAHPLRDGIRHCKKFAGLIIKEQVVVAKCGPDTCQ